MAAQPLASPVLNPNAFSADPSSASGREAWADGVKGVSILLVVLMHSLHRDESARIWMSMFVPVRMPAFFFVSGIFAVHSMQLGWRKFLGTRILHFVWLFGVWCAIMAILHFIVHPEAVPGDLSGWWEILKHPTHPLWFLTALAATYFAARSLRGIPLPAQWVLAVALCVVAFGWAPWPRVPEVGFTYWYRVFLLAPFFLAGMMGRPFLLGNASRGREAALAIACIAAYALLFAWFRARYGGFRGDFFPAWGSVPSVSLWLAMAATGTSAFVAFVRILSRRRFAPLFEYIGRNSISVFLLHIPILLVEWRLIGLISRIPGAPGALLDSTAVSVLVLFPSAVALSLWARFQIDRFGLGCLFRLPASLRAS